MRFLIGNKLLTEWAKTLSNWPSFYVLRFHEFGTHCIYSMCLYGFNYSLNCSTNDKLMMDIKLWIWYVSYIFKANSQIIKLGTILFFLTDCHNRVNMHAPLQLAGAPIKPVFLGPWLITRRAGSNNWSAYCCHVITTTENKSSRNWQTYR